MSDSSNGLISIKSNHTVPSTTDRLEQLLLDKGMNVFARIDHAKGAASIDKTLRATQLIIFGNPMSGTPLMQASQSAAIDLPMKALVSEDSDGQVWLTYNDPTYIAKRHSIEECDEVILNIENALASIAQAVAA